MLLALQRFGPDISETTSAPGCALGRNLFELTSEDNLDRQPVTGRAGDLLLVFDGRIDNRDELASALGISSAKLPVVSDAELVIRAVERWDNETVDHLIGDYAFAVFDRRAEQLTLVRDPLGGRPLFWHRTRDRIAFASMPMGLHALDGVERRPDRVRVEQLVAHLPPTGHSFFEGINRVEPGNIVIFDRDRTHVRRYWNPQPRDLGLRTFTDHVDAYRELLDRAVASRLRGTGKAVATHLSGGWDSSAVTATAARQMAAIGGRVDAFTTVPAAADAVAVPRNRFADEGPLAAAVAALHPNIDHIRLPGSHRSPIADLDGYLAVYHRPMVNLCNHVWLADIRREARARGHRVLLTGEIGNFTISNAPATILADYLRRGDWAGWAREAAGTLRTRRARVRGVLASSFGPWVPLPIWRKLECFGSGAPIAANFPLHPDRLRDMKEVLEAEASRRPRDFHQATLDGIRSLDFGEYHKGVLGGWGIDKRDPTADVRIVEFMLSLPPDMFLKGGVRRPLARAALSDRLPPAVLDEKRKGLQAADWHVGLTADRDGVRALLDRIASDPLASDILDVKLLQRLVDDWPTDNWHDPVIVARYRNALLTALSAGHFLVSV
jgi:asparagine synthase (glutamine-hydrolysing)